MPVNKALVGTVSVVNKPGIPGQHATNKALQVIIPLISWKKCLITLLTTLVYTPKKNILDAL